MGSMKTEFEVRALLRRHIDEQCGGSQREFAMRVGVSESYLSEMLRGTRGFATNVLQVLGLRRSEVYVPDLGKQEESDD